MRWSAEIRDAIAAGNDAEALAAMNAKTIAISDDTPRDRDWLIETIGPDEAARVLFSLESSVNPLIRAEYVSLNAAGVNLSRPLRQQLILELGDSDNWAPSTIAALREAGIRHLSLAEQALGREAKQSDVDDIRDELRIEAIETLRAQLENEIIAPAMQRGGDSLADVKAAIVEECS